MNDADRSQSHGPVTTDRRSSAEREGPTSADHERADPPPDPRLDRGLQGRIAQILTERELVINIGEQDGVEEGMQFAVLAGSPVQIQDPETGELLGQLDREKVRVEAIRVMERMSVCATYETRIVGGLYGIWDVSEMFRPKERVPKTLRATRESYPPPLSSTESYVKIGDVVRELDDLP